MTVHPVRRRFGLLGNYSLSCSTSYIHVVVSSRNIVYMDVDAYDPFGTWIMTVHPVRKNGRIKRPLLD